MAVSLRVVIGFSTALIVLVVAVTSVTITTVMSTDAVRDVGERLAESVADVVTAEVKGFLGQTEAQLESFLDMSQLEDYMLPQDYPNYATSDEWALPYIMYARSMMMQVDFSYSAVAMLYADGSFVGTSQSVHAPGWMVEGVQTWRNYSNGTGYPTVLQRMYRKDNRQPWLEAERGPEPPLAYPISHADYFWQFHNSVRAFGGAGCFFRQPDLDASIFNGTHVTPRFVITLACIAPNRTGHPVASASVVRILHELPGFLRQTAKTENTHLFLVDSLGLLLGATTPQDPFEVYLPEEKDVSTNSNCVSSTFVAPLSPERIGCRARVTEYPYPPLQEALAAQSDFARVRGRRQLAGDLDGKRYFYISQRIPMRFGGYSINLLLFMPEDDVLGGVKKGRDIAIGVTVAVAVLGVLVAFALVGLVLSPIDDVARRLYLTSRLSNDDCASRDGRDLDDDDERDFFSEASLAVVENPAGMEPSRLSEVRALQHAYGTMAVAMHSFTKYVPKDVVRELMAAGELCKIQMRPLRCSMLFTDIAGFTTICERVPPHILSTLVRLYFERMSRIVMGHGGVIDKFIGDCIMAVWGAPVPIDHHELRSAVCARMLTHETAQDPLKGEFAKAGEALAIRVGVATGEVLAGNMGSKARMNYTVIGDDVNLAARLEGLNKQWGTSVMVSEETAEECAEYLALRYVISIAVVGKSAPVKVFEVLGVRAEANTTVLGKSVGAASEVRTLGDVAKDEVEQEMAEHFGKANTAAAQSTVRTVGSLLRRAQRKAPVPESEVAFARAYGEAIGLWDRGDLAGCAAGLKAIATAAANGDMPTGAAERLSVQRVLEAAEAQLRAGGAPSGWTGVWVASEK